MPDVSRCSLDLIISIILPYKLVLSYDSAGKGCFSST